jgi:hypothetical protein
MKTAPKGRNLAGIVPLSGFKSAFDFPWPDYLQPIREGMLALDRSIYECAYAGCDSIWVVCNDDVAPLIKNRLGDYVMSPRYFEEKDFVKRKDYHEKWIPIYYTPINQKDRDRRDSLAWSILHGALSSFLISNKMSKWVTPTKYYVSFPFGIYDASVIRDYRSDIRGTKSFFLSHRDKTVKDGKYLGFTFFPEDWIKFKWNIKNSCTGGDKSIPAPERWSSRHFNLKRVFDIPEVKIDESLELKDYYDLTSWESLQNYYRSDIKIPRPSKQFMKPYMFKNGLTC